MPHQVHHEFICHPNHQTVLQILRANLAHRTVRQGQHRLFYLREVLRRDVDQQIDIFGGACEAMLDDGKSPDHQVFRPGVVQLAAEEHQVVRVRQPWF